MKKVSLAILTVVVLLIAVVGLTTIMVRVPTEEVKVGAKATTWIGAKYIGSEKCKECHERIYAGWKETLHSKVMQDAKANPYAILGDFGSDAKVNVKPGMYEPLPIKIEDVYLTQGSERKQCYVTLKDDKYLILPVQYNLAKAEWVPFSEGIPRDWTIHCAACHTVGYDAEKKTYTELSVGCESCHGPGGNHVNATEKLGTIVNPARLTSLAAAQVCGQCHNKGKSRPTATQVCGQCHGGGSPDWKYEFPVGYMPSANLDIYFSSKPGTWPDGTTSKSYRQQYIDWKKSKHASGGVACHNCHTVHSNDYTFQLKAPSTRLCIECHMVKATDEHRAPCKTTLCTGCHMPQTIKTSGDERESLHEMRVILPEVSVKIGGTGLAGVAKMPNSCNLCHAHEKDDPEALQKAWNEGRLVTALRK